MCTSYLVLELVLLMLVGLMRLLATSLPSNSTTTGCELSRSFCSLDSESQLIEMSFLAVVELAMNCETSSNTCETSSHVAVPAPGTSSSTMSLFL